MLSVLTRSAEDDDRGEWDGVPKATPFFRNTHVGAAPSRSFLHCLISLNLKILTVQNAKMLAPSSNLFSKHLWTPDEPLCARHGRRNDIKCDPSPFRISSLLETRVRGQALPTGRPGPP